MQFSLETCYNSNLCSKTNKCTKGNELHICWFFSLERTTKRLSKQLDELFHPFILGMFTNLTGRHAIGYRLNVYSTSFLLTIYALKL